MKARSVRPSPRTTAPIPSKVSEKIRDSAPQKPKLGKVRLKHILVPVDFSGPSKHALQFSAHFAREFNAALTLLFVSEPVGFPYKTTQTQAEVIQDAENYMTDFHSDLGLDSHLIESKIVRAGKPSYEICTVADMLKSDLIIIASYGNGKLENMLIGSTADRVVRHAHCPVLVFHQRICVPHDQMRAMEIQASKRRFKIRNIVVPIDFSTCSLKALDYALPLARKFKAKIFLVHSVPEYPELQEKTRLLDVETFQSRVRESAAMNLEVLRRSIHSGISVESVVCQGVPYVEIDLTAHEVKADLIVLTTHGHTGLAHVHLGSTAEKVVRHACCPVLVIRENEREFIGSFRK